LKGDSYEISDREMAAGSTFGSPKATLVIKATGAVERLFSVDCGENVIGSVVLHHWDEETGIPLAAQPGKFEIYPHHQQHIFELSNGIVVTEDLFVVSGPVNDGGVDPPAAYYTIALHNASERTVDISTFASAKLRGSLGHDVVTKYDQRRNAFVAWNRARPEIVRLFASSEVPESYEVTMDAGKSSATRFPGRLANKTLREASEPLGIF